MAQSNPEIPEVLCQHNPHYGVRYDFIRCMCVEMGSMFDTVQI